MDKHKGKALEDKCLCGECPHKFECFTQERIFSNPIFQGLFEALMAQGSTKEEALEQVAEEIKARIGGDGSLPVIIQPNTYPDYTTTPNTAPYTYPYTTCGDIYGSETNGGSAGTCSDISITYCMADGKEVSWTANVNYLTR